MEAGNAQENFLLRENTIIKRDKNNDILFLNDVHNRYLRIKIKSYQIIVLQGKITIFVHSLIIRLKRP